MATARALPKPSKRYMRDSRWITRHFAELSSHFANRWIAVYDGRVVASGRDRGRVIATARRKAGATDIVCHYVDDGTSIFAHLANVSRPSR